MKRSTLLQRLGLGALAIPLLGLCNRNKEIHSVATRIVATRIISNEKIGGPLNLLDSDQLGRQGEDLLDSLTRDENAFQFEEYGKYGWSRFTKVFPREVSSEEIRLAARSGFTHLWEFHRTPKGYLVWTRGTISV